jgi:agmatinase
MNETLFLAARPADDTPPRAVIQGVPYDGAVSHRAGAAAAPASVREASDSIETYSPVLCRDLTDIDLADAGDLDVDGLSGEKLMLAIAERTEALARTGAFVVTFGGDHSISMGTSTGLHEVYPDLCHVVFDAHLDMRPEYEGDPWSHACGTRRMATMGPTCALGIRSGSRPEFADADEMLVAWSVDLELPDAMREAVGARPVFVSLDIDVLDPSIVPGTGTPEPGGPTYKELRKALLALSGLNIVALDILEVAPPIDVSGLSPIVAAELAREAILRFAL